MTVRTAVAAIAGCIGWQLYSQHDPWLASGSVPVLDIINQRNQTHTRCSSPAVASPAGDRIDAGRACDVGADGVESVGPKASRWGRFPSHGTVRPVKRGDLGRARRVHHSTGPVEATAPVGNLDSGAGALHRGCASWE